MQKRTASTAIITIEVNHQTIVFNSNEILLFSILCEFMKFVGCCRNSAESNEYSALMKYGASSLRCSYSSLIATGLHTILNENTTIVTSDFLKI
jgi:hypothetical protein